MNVTGIILAGGKSSRMGNDKGLVLLNGKPMITYVIEGLKYICDQIIIITNNEEYVQFGYKLIPDLISDKGPLGGIYSGLAHSKTDVNLCLSCDSPFVTTKLLQLLIDSLGYHDVVLPSYNGRLHPLIGAYKKSCKTVFEKQINANVLKVETAYKQLKYKKIDLTENDFEASVFSNINTLEDLNNITHDS
jgi:molybdopterin-guanine dinucleotide biosynthesis protein A